MSTRQLRRLQKLREKEVVHEPSEYDEETYEPPSPPKAKTSLFANLASLDEMDSNESKETDESQTDSVHIKTQPGSSVIKPKKSKKKSRATKKADAKGVKRIDEDDIERALKELKLKEPTESSSQNFCAPNANESLEQICSVLRIQGKHLKVSNEMRNLFGKTAILMNEDTEGSREARRETLNGQDGQFDLETVLKGNHPPGKGISEVILRRNFFILGKDHWPKGPSGMLTLEIVDNQRQDGTVEFCFQHNQMYQETQQAFYRNVNTGDPESLIGQLIGNPGHISLLIQVSKIAKNQGDHSLSSDLLERALFNFGRAATSYFTTKLSQGKARLNFARPENRELWLAGYHYIKSLMMKGTYRTALEWAKLLFSLNPQDDPYCMKFMIHNLALRANEPKWLLELYDTDFFSHNVNSTARDIVSHTIPSLALAALRLQDHIKVRTLLKQSMESTPWLFSRLFTALDLETPPSIWGNKPRSSSEAVFTEIYVSQTKDLWNTSENTSLLMEVGHTILRIDSSSEQISETVTLDVARFVYLDNTREIMALVPKDLLHRSNNSDSDPLPPDKNIFSYEAHRMAIEGHPRSVVSLDELVQPMTTLLRVLNNLPDFGRHALEQVLAHVSAATNDNPDEVEREQQSSIINFTRGLLSQYRIPSSQEESVGENHDNNNENNDGNDGNDDEVEADQEISDMNAPDREASVEALGENSEAHETDVPGYLVPILVHLSSRVMRLSPEDFEEYHTENR